jgi:flagellar hook-basal body complex protein FliE
MSTFNVAAVHRTRIAEMGMEIGRSLAPSTAQPGGVSFSDSLKAALNGVSEVRDNASQHLNAFLRGEPVELHQVMAASEEAGIAVELLVEVRNKFIEAYRTLSSMQS